MWLVLLGELSLTLFWVKFCHVLATRVLPVRNHLHSVWISPMENNLVWIQEIGKTTLFGWYDYECVCHAPLLGVHVMQ